MGGRPRAEQLDPGSGAIGAVNMTELRINDIKVMGAQQGAISNPSGGTTQDAEARAAIDSILTALRNHGLIAT